MLSVAAEALKIEKQQAKAIKKIEKNSKEIKDSKDAKTGKKDYRVGFEIKELENNNEFVQLNDMRELKKIDFIEDQNNCNNSVIAHDSIISNSTTDNFITSENRGNTSISVVDNRIEDLSTGLLPCAHNLDPFLTSSSSILDSNSVLVPEKRSNRVRIPRRNHSEEHSTSSLLPTAIESFESKTESTSDDTEIGFSGNKLIKKNGHKINKNYNDIGNDIDNDKDKEIEIEMKIELEREIKVEKEIDMDVDGEEDDDDENLFLSGIIPEDLTPNPNPISYLPCVVYSLSSEEAYYSCCLDQVRAYV